MAHAYAIRHTQPPHAPFVARALWNQGHPTAAIAKALKVAPSTVRVWMLEARSMGLRAVNRPTGRPPRKRSRCPSSPAGSKP
jgi:transposase-like protein